MMSPDGICDPSTRKFKSNEPGPSDLDQTSYPTMKTGRDKLSRKSHPVVEDEVLLLIGIAFDTHAFISALETSVIVRPKSIGSMRIQVVSISK